VINKFETYFLLYYNQHFSHTVPSREVDCQILCLSCEKKKKGEICGGLGVFSPPSWLGPLAKRNDIDHGILYAQLVYKIELTGTS
jgi:hypothetical protein